MKNIIYSLFEPSKHIVVIRKGKYRRFFRQLDFLKSVNHDNWAISRKDIFNAVKSKKNVFEITIMIALWSYPSNAHGLATKIIIQKKKLVSLFEEDKKINDLDGLKSLYKKYKFPGFGFTTFTKFLYFLGFTVDKVPCIILDLKIIWLIKNGHIKFLPEFEYTPTYSNHEFYFEYIKKMKSFSDKINCKPDQVELAIYLLGGKYPILKN